MLNDQHRNISHIIVFNGVKLLSDLFAPLALGVNESYELAVSAEGRVAISSQTAWGALRGLETLSQLVEYNFTTDTYSIHDVPFRMEDAPQFQHRGLLVDSARHFLPPIRLKRTIEAMSFAKLNVLHWHLTEDESFSMPSSSHPELAEKGAWSASERYSLHDVKDIVDFAQLHGVRVIPEFDMPGHVSSWSKSHAELFDPRCLERSRRLAFEPTKEVFDFLQGLLTEWATGVFHDQFFHLGGDEVPFECWERLSVSEGGKTYDTPPKLFRHFVGSMFRRVTGPLNRSAIFWDEAFVSADLPAEAVVQVWRDKKTLVRAVQAGHRALLSWGWYLDHLNEDWQGMYDNDPVGGVPEDQKDKVLGGEGCMWGETVDGSDQAPTVWPRLAAIAERLWSAPASSAAAAETRLGAFRCLLLRRGVAAGPTMGQGRAAPPGPGSCDQRSGDWGQLA
ncbi:HEXO1 [Symbiodinium natans]|uniref:beta-N-acetylhexosaminidase n=1 Tax=Symbiodinium natans TaxID=878477 RepID=A0A812MRC3_9DINO|nr:HEXO1 [Symbiodinium natans]